MALSGEAKKQAAAAKTNRPVTLKHLAAALAEQHHLTKRAGEALLGERDNLSIAGEKAMAQVARQLIHLNAHVIHLPPTYSHCRRCDRTSAKRVR